MPSMTEVETTVATSTTTTPEPESLTVGQVAARLGLHPRDVTQLLYRSRVLYGAFPVVGGARRIPPASLDLIVMEARRHGLLPGQKGVRTC